MGQKGRNGTKIGQNSTKWHKTEHFSVYRHSNFPRTDFGAPQLQLCDRYYFPPSITKIHFEIGVNERSVVSQIISITSAHSAICCPAPCVEILSVTERMRSISNILLSITFFIYWAGQRLAEWADVIDVIWETTERSFIPISKLNFVIDHVK